MPLERRSNRRVKPRSRAHSHVDRRCSHPAYRTAPAGSWSRKPGLAAPQIVEDRLGALAIELARDVVEQEHRVDAACARAMTSSSAGFSASVSHAMLALRGDARAGRPSSKARDRPYAVRSWLARRRSVGPLSGAPRERFGPRRAAPGAYCTASASSGAAIRWKAGAAPASRPGGPLPDRARGERHRRAAASPSPDRPRARRGPRATLACPERLRSAERSSAPAGRGRAPRSSKRRRPGSRPTRASARLDERPPPAFAPRSRRASGRLLVDVTSARRPTQPHATACALVPLHPSPTRTKLAPRAARPTAFRCESCASWRPRTAPRGRWSCPGRCRPRSG